VVGLELGEHAEHVEEALAGGGAGVDRLLARLQGGALGLQGADDILEVADAARQAIDPGDHQHIALAQEVEYGAQLLAAGRGSAAALLRSNDFAAGRLKRRLLDLEILVDGAYARVLGSL
jgi:hypothetical protein